MTDLCSTATTAERFFRIDQAHEHLHYATDIFSEELFIVYLDTNMADSVVEESDQGACKTTVAKSVSIGSCGHRQLKRISVYNPSTDAE